MTLYDEINFIMEKLTTAWGSVCVACDKSTCQVGDGVDRVFEAPTLLEALQAAEATLDADVTP